MCLPNRQLYHMILGMVRLLDAICEAIETSGKTRYGIAKDTGISQTQLSRLMSAERGLSIDTLERLAEYLDLEIVIRKRRKRPAARR